MVNILLEGYDIAAPWLRAGLRRYLRPGHSVAVVALSFRDNRVHGPEDWAALYSAERGMYYGGITGGFEAYGISRANISFIDYFTDTPATAARKVERADIVYFLGGLPDRMLARIRDMELYDVLARHDGIAIGYSAGAVIQLREYYLAPDDDYAEFNYYEGLPYLSDFYLQVHCEGTLAQRDAIRRALTERGKPVYALAHGAGGLIVEDGRVTPLGEVRLYRPGALDLQ